MSGFVTARISLFVTRRFQIEDDSVFLSIAACLLYASVLNLEVTIPVEAKGSLVLSDVVRANLSTAGRKYGLAWAVLGYGFRRSHISRQPSLVGTTWDRGDPP